MIFGLCPRLSTHRYINHIIGLDISPRKVYPPFNSHTFSLRIDFQHNPNLPEMAMQVRRSKGLKVKPPRDVGSRLEAFSFGE
jgi:hypothetical protein